MKPKSFTDAHRDPEATLSHQDGRQRSFSPRERAGVRGKKASGLPIHYRTFHGSWNSVLGFGLAMLLCEHVALANPEAAAATSAPPPAPRWETTAAAGITLTRGNSKTLLATLGLDTKKKWEKNEAAFGVAGGYGENDGTKNTEFIQGFGQYNRLFTERFYGGLRFGGSYDGIAGLDYRIRITPLAGYYLVKQTNTTLVAEIGPSAVFEKHTGESPDSYLGLRLGERLDHKLSDTTKIWESVDYVPDVKQWSERYVVTAEAGIDTAINKHWSLRVVCQDIYDSQPTPGRQHNDLRLVAGTAYKF